MDSYSSCFTQFGLFAPSDGTPSFKGSKRKTLMVDVMGTQFDKLTTKLDVFVDEIRTGNALIEKLSSIVERQFMAFERVFVTSERQVQYSERQILAIEK